MQKVGTYSKGLVVPLVHEDVNGSQVVVVVQKVLAVVFQQELHSLHLVLLTGDVQRRVTLFVR